MVDKTEKSPGLFLDRDGVIIENCPDYVLSWADVHFFPQALSALVRIRDCPFKIIVVTNQSAVGRGRLSFGRAAALNERIMAEVRRRGGRIDGAYICPDAPQAETGCRKPEPGMLLQAAGEHHLALGKSIMIGDALSDIEAGRRAGVKEARLLLTGRGRAQLALPAAAALAPIAVFDDLSAALADF